MFLVVDMCANTDNKILSYATHGLTDDNDSDQDITNFNWTVTGSSDSDFSEDVKYKGRYCEVSAMLFKKMHKKSFRLHVFPLK